MIIYFTIDYTIPASVSVDGPFFANNAAVMAAKTEMENDDLIQENRDENGQYSILDLADPELGWNNDDENDETAMSIRKEFAEKIGNHWKKFSYIDGEMWGVAFLDTGIYRLPRFLEIYRAAIQNQIDVRDRLLVNYNIPHLASALEDETSILQSILSEIMDGIAEAEEVGIADEI